jgi:ribosomal protein S18 acetylase RimI-like enzyme
MTGEPAPAPTGDVTIRPFRPADAPRVKAITAEAFAEVSIDAAVDRRWPGVASAPWWERKWRAMQPQVAEHPEHCWVAVAGDEVVGYVTCEVLADVGVGRIPDLAVAAEWRGGGLGRRLLLHALDHFRRLGLSLAKIETLGHNQVGRHLYPSLGFQHVATQYHYVMPLQPAEGAGQSLDRAATPDAPEGTATPDTLDRQVQREGREPPGAGEGR